MLAEFVIILVTLVLLIIYFQKAPKGLPPGEWGLPIVGYVPFVNWKLTKTLKILEKKHGKIFSLKLGVYTFIVIGDYSLIKEAYGKLEVAGRPALFGLDHLFGYGHFGLSQSSGHIWKTNRRFAVKTLKDLGLGKSKMEEAILLEAENLVKELKKNVNKTCTIDWNLNIAILNVIWRFVADRSFDINNENMKDFSRYLHECFEDIEGPMAFLNIFPWLLPFLPKFIKNSWMKLDRVEEKRNKIFKSFLETIQDNTKTLDPNNPRDFIDKYLTENQNQKDNPEFAHWGDDDLLATMLEFFTGGSDTTSSTIRWFFLYMAKHPEIQKRVQKEIDNVLPRDKLPAMQDKDRLPSLQALNYEVSRVASVVPTSLPHESLEDITLGGYHIPKGSVIVPNSESIHSDSNIWDYPNEFSLDNFLDKDGKFLAKEGFMAFSTGRRQCPGEGLAKMELFIFMGAILQNFEILKPEDQEISLIPDQKVNIFNYPPKCNVLLKNRT